MKVEKGIILTNEDKSAVELYELVFSLLPQDVSIIEQVIHSIDDIILYKNYLKYREFNLQCYKHLLKVLLDNNKKVLVKTDGQVLRILRCILRYNPNLVFDEETSHLSFGVFKKYIFHKSDEIAALANRVLLGVSLSNEELGWLLDDISQSSHILNRILRYPQYCEVLSQWATCKFNCNELIKRKSELLGLIVYDSVPENLEYSSNELIWGIYYSRAPVDIKKGLLYKAYKSEVIDDFLDVCIRLRYYDIIEKVLQERFVQKSKISI